MNNQWKACLKLIMFYIQCDVHKARKGRLGGAAFGGEKEHP